jgi:hypothetical protein
MISNATRLLTTSAACLAVVIAAAGCTTTEEGTAERTASPTASASPSPTAGAIPATPPPGGHTASPAAPGSSPTAINRSTPDAVCQAFTAALFTIDTARGDTSWDSAAARAAAYVVPKLANELTNGPHRGDAQWTTWISHRASTTVETAAGDNGPADTPTNARRAWSASYTPHGRDNWTGPRQEAVIYCTLTKGNDGWRIERYEQQ